MIQTRIHLEARALAAPRPMFGSRRVMLLAGAMLASLSLLSVDLPAQGRGQGKDKSKGSIGQQQAGQSRGGRDNRENRDNRDDRDDRDDRGDRNDRDNRDDRYNRGNGVRGGKIPPGHMPSAGECRVWFDGRPPGQQPRPTSCARARADAYRSGGRVIYGDDRRNTRYEDRDDERYPNDRRYPNEQRYPDDRSYPNDRRVPERVGPVTLPDVLADVIRGRAGRVP